MRTFLKIFALSWVGLSLSAAPEAAAVTRQQTTVNGLAVDQFIWRDSKNLPRSVSLKRQGAGNPGNGGYAVRMTYYYYTPQGVLTPVTANARAGDGFGYFVSHERYRAFTDGASSPIAQKIFGRDDSPLGLNFPVQTLLFRDSATWKIMRYELNYPRYGTKVGGGIDPNTGEDNPKIGLSQNLFTLYQMPVYIYWFFEDGKDHPRIRTVVFPSVFGGPNRASFDLRGPYGTLDFDHGNNSMYMVMWGDRYHFNNTTTPLTRNSRWNWNTLNNSARYQALLTGRSEMGLVEPLPFRNSRINDGFAFGRGKTYATHDAAAAGCPNQELPCDYEWPYQSAQYSLPYNNPNGTATAEKIAWGSAPFYGMNIGSTWDGTQSTPFVGYPPNGQVIYYDVCVVLGERNGQALTKRVAAAGGNYNCAKAQ